MAKLGWGRRLKMEPCVDEVEDDCVVGSSILKDDAGSIVIGSGTGGVVMRSWWVRMRERRNWRVGRLLVRVKDPHVHWESLIKLDSNVSKYVVCMGDVGSCWGWCWRERGEVEV